MLMPPPMVPAPMTATLLISRTGVSEGTSAILVVARCATNKWRKARDSGVHIRLVKISRSASMAWSNFILVAFCTASMHFRGAGYLPLVMPLTILVVNLKKASALGCLQGKSRTRGKGEVPTTLRANAMASSIKVAALVAIWSKSFCPGNMASISLLMGSPLTIMFNAGSTPNTRGKRWVPPAPGMRPSLTSGNATSVPGAAMR